MCVLQQPPPKKSKSAAKKKEKKSGAGEKVGDETRFEVIFCKAVKLRVESCTEAGYKLCYKSKLNL